MFVRALLWVAIWSFPRLTIQMCSSFLVPSAIESPITRASKLSLTAHSVCKLSDDFHFGQKPTSVSKQLPLGIFKNIRRSLWSKLRYVLAVISLSIALWGGPRVNEASAVITVLPGTGGITRHTSKPDGASKRSDPPKQHPKKKKSTEKKKIMGKVQMKEKRTSATKVKREEADSRVPSVLSRLETPSSKNASIKSSTLKISKPQSKPKKQRISAESENRRGLSDATKVVVVTGSGLLLGLSASKQQQAGSNDDVAFDMGRTMGGLREESVKMLFKGREYAGTVATKVSEQGEIVKQVVAEEWKRSGELGSGTVSSNLKQVVAEEWKRSGESQS